MDILQAILQSEEVINFLIFVITGCVGYVSKQAVKYLKRKGIIAKIESNKQLANIVVNAIEQTYKNVLHGDEKLNMAKIELIKLAKDKGVKISEKEIDLLIENSVKEMNKAVKEETK